MTIIALLIAILLPSLKAARAVARSAVCMSVLHQYQLTQMNFSLDNDWMLFRHMQGNVATGGNPNLRWAGQFATQMFPQAQLYTAQRRGIDLPACPEATQLRPSPPYAGFGAVPYLWGQPGVWTDTWLGDYTGSYAFNAWMYEMSQFPSGTTGTHGPVSRYYQRVPNIPQPAIAPVFVDGAWCETWPMHTDGTNGNLEDPYTPWTGIEMSRVTMTRHPNGTVNGVFADGSSRSLRMKDLWTLKWNQLFNTNTGFDPGG